MDNTINNLFIAAVGAADPEQTIQVQFYNRPGLVTYPARMMDLLKNDPHVEDIIDPGTGEILFTHDCIDL